MPFDISKVDYDRGAFGEALTKLKKRDGFNTKDIAERTGFTSSYISSIEHGHTKPSENVAIKIAMVFKEDYYDMLAVAGKIDKDVQNAIINRPAKMSDLILMAEKMSDDNFNKLMNKAFMIDSAPAVETDQDLVD